VDIIVGPRSALFSPFNNLGLIVVDECDDDSYCQADYGIYYDTRVLVQDYSSLLHAVSVFGSATPDISMRYEALENNWTVLNLPTRIQVISQPVQGAIITSDEPVSPTMGDLPGVQIVDMREELKSGNRSILSNELQQSLRDTLYSSQQAILYLNRRGKATYVFCRTCGHVIKCPRCDLPLTSHGDKNELICHQCGYRREQPKRCPQCDSTAIRQLGTGTETMEAAVRQLLPDANILRWDSETSRFKDAHEIILSHFINHRADILIGTQMISKGLDFPLVTLVGVILAETGLSIPDYRANERTFQLLTQVAGRSGRSDLGGRVIFQTFQPENYVIQYAARHDYNGFYSQELGQRRRLGYPPFYQIVRLEITNLSSDFAQKTAYRLHQKIIGWVEASGLLSTEVIGPVPCYFGKLNNLFRWQIVLRGTKPSNILKEHMEELAGVHVEVDPPNLL
jgi:primosomal protein N' (replication factor Y)